jgi:hypothetical protein
VSNLFKHQAEPDVVAENGKESRSWSRADIGSEPFVPDVFCSKVQSGRSKISVSAQRHTGSYRPARHKPSDFFFIWLLAFSPVGRLPPFLIGIATAHIFITRYHQPVGEAERRLGLVLLTLALGCVISMCGAQSVGNGYVSSIALFVYSLCDPGSRLVGWQWYKDKKNQLEGRPRRKDCESLLQLHHNAGHLDRSSLTMMLQNAPVIFGYRTRWPVNAVAGRPLRELQ